MSHLRFTPGKLDVVRNLGQSMYSVGPILLIRSYFLRSAVSALPFGQTGLTNSVRQIGPLSKDGPSDFKNIGKFPPEIQTRVSGGCFPTNGATTPRTPPISILMTYRVAVRLAPPVENESSPSAVIASLTPSSGTRQSRLSFVRFPAGARRIYRCSRHRHRGSSHIQLPRPFQLVRMAGGGVSEAASTEARSAAWRGGSGWAAARFGCGRHGHGCIRGRSGAGLPVTGQSSLRVRSSHGRLWRCTKKRAQPLGDRLPSLLL